jgi:hypothetical protein
MRQKRNNRPALIKAEKPEPTVHNACNDQIPMAAARKASSLVEK